MNPTRPTGMDPSFDPPSLPLPNVPLPLSESPRKMRISKPVNELSALNRIGALLEPLGPERRGLVLKALAIPHAPDVANIVAMSERLLGHLTPEGRAKVLGFLGASENTKNGAA